MAGCSKCGHFLSCTCKKKSSSKSSSSAAAASGSGSTEREHRPRCHNEGCGQREKNCKCRGGFNPNPPAPVASASHTRNESSSSDEPQPRQAEIPLRHLAAPVPAQPYSPMASSYHRDSSSTTHSSHGTSSQHTHHSSQGSSGLVQLASVPTSGGSMSDHPDVYDMSALRQSATYEEYEDPQPQRAPRNPMPDVMKKNLEAATKSNIDVLVNLAARLDHLYKLGGPGRTHKSRGAGDMAMHSRYKDVQEAAGAATKAARKALQDYPRGQSLYVADVYKYAAECQVRHAEARTAYMEMNPGGLKDQQAWEDHIEAAVGALKSATEAYKKQAEKLETAKTEAMNKLATIDRVPGQNLLEDDHTEASLQRQPTAGTHSTHHSSAFAESTYSDGPDPSGVAGDPGVLPKDIKGKKVRRTCPVCKKHQTSKDMCEPCRNRR